MSPDLIERLPPTHAVLLLLAWVVSDITIPILIYLAPRLGAVDRPHSYKIHREPMPFLGGVGIFIGFMFAVFSLLRFETQVVSNAPLYGIVFGAGVVVVLGLIDDFKPISAVLKLVILLISTWVLSRFNIVIDLFPEWLEPLNYLLTLFWIAGVTSAMNSLDNMDGAAGGVAAVAALFSALIAWRNYEASGSGLWQTQQKWLCYLSIATFGACCGFLRYNFKPARIFLGDNGSFLIGFILSAMAVLGAWSFADPLRSFIIPCALFVVPLYDITLSTVLRLRRGVVKGVVGAIVYCGRDHISHRRVALGYSQREAVLMLYLFGSIGGAIAYFCSRPQVDRAMYLGVTVAAMAVLVAVGAVLDRAPVYVQGSEGSKEAGPA
ncbi:MAG: undecaprenyl/decaprenyl-phosphate alpha-N-acetylglucosaminyl 1-phosphate transferase [Planctomycetes bacterium]|nr:undecaprenyl/decaprenyl-phosphate alpha-N-acetylglucosaminyl 1-phosphate transferase [Planctomycetota bacterium]